MNLPFEIKAKIVGAGRVGRTYACRACGAEVFVLRPTTGVYPKDAACVRCEREGR
mgnify:FL=1